ncbi:unnamed protein product [Rotaria sp. Silwood2]|nr:unnamed protein product [Rotaria sp. Silwood2]CAF3333689.1 unnamed protein product [Rotaria sp. Silwood2]
MSNPPPTCEHKELWNTLHNNTFQYDYQMYSTTFNYAMKKKDFELVGTSENQAKFRLGSQTIVVNFGEHDGRFIADMKFNNKTNEVIEINMTDYLNKDKHEEKDSKKKLKRIVHLNSLVSHLNTKIDNVLKK